jgi:hypothetical protein
MTGDDGLVLTQPDEWFLLRWSSRWAELLIDKPSGSGVYGFLIRLGQLRLSVTYPARDWDADPLRPGVPGSYDGPPVDPTRGEAP